MREPIVVWNPARDVWELPGVTSLLCEHWAVYSAIWPASGSMRNGAACGRPTWARPIRATASSSLLKTPTAQLASNGGSQHPDKRRAGGHGPTLADEVEHLFLTPVAAEGIKPSNTMGVARRMATGQPFLTNQIVTLLGLDPSELTGSSPAGASTGQRSAGGSALQAALPPAPSSPAGTGPSCPPASPSG